MTRIDRNFPPAPEKQRVTTGGEFPNTDQIKAYGDLSFLFLRSKLHATATAPMLLHFIQPAVDSGQFTILRQGHIPRACITWALMDETAEDRFLSGQPLESQDWYSGNRLWIIDIVAPYEQGTGGQVLKWFSGGLPDHVTTVNALRPGRNNLARHFTATRMANGRWGCRVKRLTLN